MISETKPKPTYKIQSVDEYLKSGGKITIAKRGEVSKHDTRPWDIKRTWKRKVAMKPANTPEGIL